MEILIVAVVIGLLPAAIAKSKGHSFVGWWIFGAALFIVALPCSLFLKRNIAQLDKEAIDNGMFKKCPACAELVKREAIICRYCRHDFLKPPQQIDVTPT